jgi:phage nucleotide-binding protein
MTPTATAEKPTQPKLDLVVPPTGPVQMNVALYGPAKTGKTTGATSLPGKTLLVNSDRPNASRFAHETHGDRLDEIHATGLGTLVAVIEAMQTGFYESVVIDTVGELYRVVLEDLSGRALSPKIQQYGNTGTHIERFCRALVEEPVHVAFVLHENPVKDEESGSIERMPYTGTKNPALAEKIVAMVDVIGYTGVVRDSETKEVSYVAQTVNGGGRRGGSRWEVLQPSAPLDLSAWINAIEGQPAKAGKD